MSIRTVRKMAAKVGRVGTNKVKIKNPETAAEAVTKEDVRGLIEAGDIQLEKPRGVSRGRARQRKEKRKVRRKGFGSRKGTKTARLPRKNKWMIKVRALRRRLKQWKSEGKLKPTKYRRLYLMVKGGYFRDTKHLRDYAKIKEEPVEKKPKKKPVKKKPKKQKTGEKKAEQKKAKK